MLQIVSPLRFLKHVVAATAAERHSFYAFFFVLFTFLPITSSAKTLENTTLTLDEALTLSLQSYPLIAAREREFQAAVGDLSAAKWALFPNASFSFRGFRENDTQNALDQEVLIVSQPLWTGGKLSGNISEAAAKRDVAKYAVIEAEQALIRDTASAFIEMYRAKQKQIIAARDVTEHERLFDIIQRKVNASTSPEVDLRLARARLAFSRAQVLQAGNAMEVSRANLEQLVGQAVHNVSVPQRFHAQKPSLRDAEAAAIAFSPAIRKMQADIEALAAAAKVANSALYPQLSVGYEKRFGELATNQEREQVFVGLDFQPGAGLSSRSSGLASQQRKRAMQDNLLALEREIRREVQVAWREFSAAEMQLAPTQLLVESTSEVMASYLRQYTVGRKSWLDVLNAQRELVQAQQALADHEAKVNMASYKIQILVGNLTKKTVMDQSE